MAPFILNPHTVSGLRQNARVESDAPDGTPLYDLDQLVNYTVKEKQIDGISFEPTEPILEDNKEKLLDKPVQPLGFEYTDSNMLSFESITAQVLEDHQKVKDKMRDYMIIRNQARNQKIEALQDDYMTLQIDWEARCNKDIKIASAPQMPNKRSRRGDAVVHVELTNRRNANMSRKPASAVPQHVVAEATPTPPAESSEMEVTDSSSVFDKAVQEAEPLHLVDENSKEEMENEKVLSRMLQRLQAIDKKDPHVKAERTQAHIPNQELSSIDRWSCAYNDANARVLDPISYFERSHESEFWSEDEKEIFLKAYVDTPKSFAEIAEKIPNKSVQDCVLFYYMNKKVRVDYEKFKGLSFTRRGVMRRGKRNRKGGALLADISTTQSREQKTVPSAPHHLVT
ncbi:hypothetical protein E3Q22_02343 [Wallemia mellicola]|uniref:SANT domain-containing protein n=1 Tax=Wallemia mellicola TaxID=1708541 RepID=A0A4T0NM63_9BASI|nr:hypothetical protein E3Q22_02343 [Wallemia mellicola]TIB98279.1 hypothetical protein E3Q18_02111 [Wallemia mellicola]TIC06411.1 hypothetical protein E3Q16_01177 [Wallemia mellicola]TIC45363.1 hypothetical protein E3Q08_01314 [Wallemia mellicola]